MAPRYFVVLAVLALGFAPAPFLRHDEDAAKADLAALQGEWVGVSSNNNGEEWGPIFDYTIKGDRLSFDCSGGGTVTFRIVLHPKQAPKKLELVDPKTKESWPGLYRVDGDTFVLCHGCDEKLKERPRSFRPGEGVSVDQFRRKR
jgi:uncharacterized protein (TIGR03067 family)